MDKGQWDKPGDAIRITHEDAMSSHVDDLLKRQKSLRGESGITRERKRKWYYQNWFVLMLAGTVAALIAWAIIEPYFDDLIYIQGEIDSVDKDASLPGEFGPYAHIPGLSSMQIRGETIFIIRETRQQESDDEKVPLNLNNLHRGQEVGVYFIAEPSTNLPFADTVLLSPTEEPPTKAMLSISNLLARSAAAGLLLFPLVAGLVGLAIGAVDGLVCRLPMRALLGATVGFIVGFIGGFISTIIAGLVYMPLNRLALAQSGTDVGSLSACGFLVQMSGRALAWGLAGMAMGLAQGITLRSKRLLLYGFLGGIIGGLLGGLFFDPIDLLILGTDKPSAHWSRLIGFAIIGASVGAMIGIVELIARDAWLRMTEGPLMGKEFLIFKDVMNIGSSPRSDIYLFNDPQVAGNHARIRAIGEECEIERISDDYPLLLNNRPIHRARLRHGDQIRLGNTAFVFQKQGG